MKLMAYVNDAVVYNLEHMLDTEICIEHMLFISSAKKVCTFHYT